MQPLRLATRTSRLALWQADQVAKALWNEGITSEIVPLKTTGDVDLINPIYEIGVQGVFTRELDIALLRNDADIAVHSLKDMPIVPAEGTMIGAVLRRGDHRDVLIHKGKKTSSEDFMIATCSIRRRSQWLERFPKHQTTDIRGNIETRLEKLDSSPFDGLIMAKAALDRLRIDRPFVETLDWMLPAPGQGAIAIACRYLDHEVWRKVLRINDSDTHQSVTQEREFLHSLKGGCSAPISAHAYLDNNTHVFEGAVHSLDGRQSYRIKRFFDRTSSPGKRVADEVLANPEARSILDEIFRQKPELGE